MQAVDEVRAEDRGDAMPAMTGDGFPGVNDYIETRVIRDKVSPAILPMPKIIFTRL